MYIRGHKRALMGELRPWSRIGHICSAEGDPPTGGGETPPGTPPPGDPPKQGTIPGTDDPPKMLSQEKVNAILADERRKSEAKIAELQEKAAKVDDLTKRLEQLEEEKDMAGKTAEERERARAKKERETLLADKERLEAEKAAADAKLASAVEEHRNTRARHTLSLALSSAKVFAPSAADALESMIRDSTLEFADDGSLKTITLNDGIVYDDMKKAATAYLAAKPYFAEGSLGGTGTRPPTGGRGGNGKPLKEMSREERLKLGNEQRAARRNQ